jgi:hypothetical protein
VAYPHAGLLRMEWCVALIIERFCVIGILNGRVALGFVV